MGDSKPKIGFIGQGYVGKNYGDDFEERGYEIVRYSLEEAYIANKDKIKDCDIVFVAVWTPTTPAGFDSSIIESVLPLIGDGKIAIIKSTILPGTTKRLQEQFPHAILLYSPEFLSVATATEDARHPFSNIIGMSRSDQTHRDAAHRVMGILPVAPFTLMCSSEEAEVIKYAHNASAYVQIVMFNMMYDIAQQTGSDWNVVHQALQADPYISNRYAQPIHKSGRGAGGGCFIKDFSALRGLYETILPTDVAASKALRALECKNIDLLTRTKKDPDLLRGVYGDNPESICGAS